MTWRRGILNEPVSILLPVCDEFEGIEAVLAELVEVVYRHLPEGSELLIEESGSEDGTKRLLEQLNQRWPFLDIVYNERREGFGAAARALYRRARCPWVFFTDSDGQCVASEFWRLAEQMENHDFILGVKRVRYDPLVRRVTSRVFNSIARALFAVPGQDINFGFRLARRDAVLACLERCGDLPTLLNAEVSIFAHALGYRILPVTVHHRPRIFGLSRGLTFGRIGCQLSGDGDWGINNLAPKPGWMSFLPDWMWAYRYPHNVLKEEVPIEGCTFEYCKQLAEPVYPTPFYEVIMMSIVFAILWSIRKRFKAQGMIFFIYLGLIAIERFIIEKIRVNVVHDVLGFQLTQAEIISIVLFCISVGGMVYVSKFRKGSEA